jgi:hypothetical protein
MSDCRVCCGSGSMFHPDLGEVVCRCVTTEMNDMRAEIERYKRLEDAARSWIAKRPDMHAFLELKEALRELEDSDAS